jgi:tetratricopeptide (TPR) repeat protein
VRTIGWVNFLDDSSQTPHMKLPAIDQVFGVAQATGQAKSKAIRDLLKIRLFDTEWTLPSRIGQNPMAWMIQVNGLLVDARSMPREIQEEAFRKGLIPHLPAEAAEEPLAADPDRELAEATGNLSQNAAADAACLVGELHLRQGEYEKAVQAFTQAIEGSASADAYEGRAKAYRALADRDERKVLERRLQP